mgnify:CR=1 FL=1
MVLEIIFYIISGYVVYQLNKELHRDIFPSNEVPKRQWKFINEIDGKEYTLEEM